MEASEDVDARVYTYTATSLGSGRVATPTLGRLYPEESLDTYFYRRLSESQDQSGYEGVKKNLHPSNTRDRTRAVQLPLELPGPYDVTYSKTFKLKIVH